MQSFVCEFCGAPAVGIREILDTPLCERRAKTGKCDRGQPVKVLPLPGRNALCLCGSGKKYKNCCLKTIS